MKKKTLLLLSVLCFLGNSLFAQIIDYYDDVVEDLYQEYIQEGRIPPFFYGPLLAGQVNSAANEISSSHYIANPNQNGATFSAFANLQWHLFSKEETIEKVGSTSIANNGIDYTKNYLSKPTFLALAADFSSEIGLGGGTQIGFRSRFENDYFETFNVFGTVDSNLLTKAYLYFDNPYVSLLIGRLNTQMGLLYADAIFFNNNIPYTDSIRLFIPFGKYFNLHWQMTNIPAVKSRYQEDVKTGNDFKPEYAGSLGIDGKPSGIYQDYFYGFEGDDFPSIILNMYQRFGFQNDFMRVGASFNVFLARRNNRFEFADLFPFAEWHSTDVIPNNMSLGLDFAIVPTENLLFSLQAGFDDINGSAFGIDDSAVPTIWSIIGTMQNTLVTKPVNVFFSTNVGYNHYLWGNFSGKGAGDDNANSALGKAIYRYNAQAPMYLPYTSTFGPGAFWVSQQAIITFPQNSSLGDLRIAPEATLLVKDINTNLIDIKYKTRTKSDAQMVYFALEVPASYKWRTLEASIAPSFHLTGWDRPTTTWFELKLSLKAHFSASIFEKNDEAVVSFEY